MIELKDVAKRFRITPGPGRKAGVVEALAGVTATIEAGEIVAVVGPNGAGKLHHQRAGSFQHPH